MTRLPCTHRNQPTNHRLTFECEALFVIDRFFYFILVLVLLVREVFLRGVSLGRRRMPSLGVWSLYWGATISWAMFFRELRCAHMLLKKKKKLLFKCLLCYSRARAQNFLLFWTLFDRFDSSCQASTFSLPPSICKRLLFPFYGLVWVGDRNRESVSLLLRKETPDAPQEKIVVSL